MMLPQYLLLFAFQLYNGLASSERNVTLEIFVDQIFQSEVCEAGIPPVWHIDGNPLIYKDIIQNIYRAQVERDYDKSTGNWQATLIMNQVYLFNGSVITCSANLTLILMYRLEVVNLTVKWLPMNESFTSAVCTSPFVDSPPPYWVINRDILSNLTIIKRYGAEIDRPTQDQNGRHQTILTIRSVSAKLNGSNISCVVDSEIRRMYILYVLPEENMYVATTDHAMTEDEPAKTTKDIAEISSGNLRDIGTAVGVPVGLVLLLVLAIALVAVIYAVYLHLKKCKTANAELNTTVSELIHDNSAHSATVAEGSQLSSESSNALVMPRRQYGLPASNMQRGVANGGIEGAPDAENTRNQDVRPHHENEREIPDGGACQGQCIPEENQGEGHAAAKVFGKVSVQNFPNGPLKVYLTDKEILKEEMD